MRSPDPAFITVDLSAEPEDIEQVMVLLQTHGWQDLGAIASTWGGEDLVPTCLTARSNEPTRRDYIFANRLALPLVRGFFVIPADLCPAHATLQVYLALDAPAYYVNKLRAPLPLESLVYKSFEMLCGAAPEAIPEEQLLDSQWQLEHPDDAIPTAQLKD